MEKLSSLPSSKTSALGNFKETQIKNDYTSIYKGSSLSNNSRRLNQKNYPTETICSFNPNGTLDTDCNSTPLKSKFDTNIDVLQKNFEFLLEGLQFKEI